MTEKENKISNLVTAIVSKVTSLISTHNNDNNAHSDIRNAIPAPSTSNPLSDTASGSVGNSSTYAKANHTHPKSDLYDVTVEKQQTAETGFVATYVIKQNNTQVGSKINIPKDFLVKSATMQNCTTANFPLNGLKVGDPYLDFVVNSIDNDASNSHIYINVSDLVDAYTAGTGLTLSSGLVLTAPSSCGVGQSVTLSAELSCGYNDGTISVPDFGGKLAGATVKFKIGNTIVGTGVTNNNGVATCNYTFTAVGSYSVTAVFEGSTDFGSVTSNAVTVVPIDLTVASDKDSFSQVGETATITCTLMNNNGGISGETLSYVMKDANNTVIDSGTGTTDSNGEVELSYTAADAGDVTVTVDCMSLQKTCILHDIIYNIVLSASKTSANIGESVTFTATVKRSNNNPVSGETVTFKDIENNVVLGTATTNASGVCSVSYSWNHSDSLYIQSMIDNSGSNSINITILQGKINTSIIMKHTDYYLIDANNNGVSGKTVHCSSKAGTTDKITNSNGRIDYGSWTSLVFDGDSEYNGCSYP